jgi:hypothetical protein
MADWRPALRALVWLLAAALLFVSCRHESKSGDARFDDDDDSPTAPIDDDDDADEHWGLWHGVWNAGSLGVEEVPAPGALGPNLAATSDGSLAVLSTRKTQETSEQGVRYVQLLYLTRKRPTGEWRDPLELAKFSWSSQNSALLAAADDSLHVLFSYEDQPAHLMVVESQVTADLLQTGPSPPTYFAIAQSPKGEIHAVFGDWSLSHQVRLENTWQALDVFDDGSFPDLAFSPAAEDEGRLTFMRYKGVGAACDLVHFAWTGGQWRGGDVAPDVDFYPTPHLVVDADGRSHILAPSAHGLLYLEQDESVEGGWRMEVIAGNSEEMGQDHADLALPDGKPIAVYRDARTARGFVAFRADDDWETDELTGFDGGFIGLTLAVDPQARTHMVFAAARVNP